MALKTRNDLVVLPKSETPADRSIEKRRLRKHYVLNVIREKGPLSRADIAKASGFNLPSVSSLVDELVEGGLVFESEAREIPRGRRPIPVSLNANAACVLGIDVGKQSTIAVVTNLAGSVLSRFEKPSPATIGTAKGLTSWSVEVARSLMAGGGVSLPPLCGIGVGVPGLIGHGPGGDDASKFPAGQLRRRMEEEFGVAALVENDARMMALGSLWFDVGKQYSSFAVINIGHGIGCGIVIEGRVFAGAHGFAGELGYVPVGEKGVEGYLGHPDALENVASGSGLLRLAAKAKLKVKSAADLAKLADDGDARAKAVFAEFADCLGKGIATIVNMFDPQAVILGGRVCRSSRHFIDATRDAVKRHALMPIASSCELRVSGLDVDLGPMGAAATVLHHIFTANHIGVEEVI